MAFAGRWPFIAIPESSMMSGVGASGQWRKVPRVEILREYDSQVDFASPPKEDTFPLLGSDFVLYPWLRRGLLSQARLGEVMVFHSGKKTFHGKRIIRNTWYGHLLLSVVFALVAFGCGKDPLLIRRGSGTIQIVSEPQGAVVIFDGSPRGWTYEKKPIVLRGVPHGWHTIRATLPGRVPRIEEVELGTSNLEVRIPLDTQSFGRLTVYTSPPGAEVYIGSRFYGTTDPRIEINSLPYGQHNLWVRLKGYQDKRHNIIVERQADRAYRILLTKE